MKNKILIRVDEKLLHAQIMLMWVRNSDIRKIIVVDDVLASNPFLIKVYELSVPSYIAIEIMSTYDFSTLYGEEKIYKQKQKTLVILGSIDLLKKLMEYGVSFLEIQIGFTSHEQLGKEKAFEMIEEEIHNKIREESDTLKVYYQNAPDDIKQYIT